jgi:hypothetical protein
LLFLVDLSHLSCTAPFDFSAIFWFLMWSTPLELQLALDLALVLVLVLVLVLARPLQQLQQSPLLLEVNYRVALAKPEFRLTEITTPSFKKMLDIHNRPVKFSNA